MSLKSEAIKRFLTAARSLASQGLSKEAIMQFAKNEFGEITELFQKQIDNIFKRPPSGIEKIKIKDEVFDDTVVKLPYDDTGQPFNPKDPLKDYSKKSKKAGKGKFTKAEYLIQRLKNTIKENPDDAYVQENFPNFIKELEANPDLAKNENVFKELGGDLPNNQKITVYDDDTLDFATLKPTKKFKLNKERFQKDFNVSDDEVEKILKMSSEEQRDVVNKYIDKDFKERIQLSDYDVTDLEPNAEGGIVGYYTGGLVDVEPSLSDIGHGADALMARTRLLSPGAQGTTSTGLNYLLAEDNDNIRIPFSKGKLADAARRKFMKTAGAGAAGLAALKTGLINLAQDAGPKVEMVKETVSKTPDYFFDLVSKIKMFGKEGTPLSERMNVTNYKNFELTEDISTGDMRITKQAGDPDGPGYKEEVMEYSKGGNPMEEGGQTIERYEEATLFPDMDGKMKDIEDGIEPDSIKEIMEEITEIKKASGGIAKLLGE